MGRNRICYDSSNISQVFLYKYLDELIEFAIFALNLFLQMRPIRKKKTITNKISIFQKIMEDKKAIREHIASGNKLSDLKKKGYKFAKPL